MGFDQGSMFSVKLKEDELSNNVRTEQSQKRQTDSQGGGAQENIKFCTEAERRNILKEITGRVLDSNFSIVIEHQNILQRTERKLILKRWKQE